MSHAEDWIAICEAKARYCRAVDDKDWDAFADCFADDAVFELPPAGNIQRGRATIRAFVSASVATATTAHHVHNPEIAFTGDDGARVVWALEDRVLWPTGDGPGYRGHTGYGNYHERWHRDDDGRWRIATSRLSYRHMDIERG